MEGLLYLCTKNAHFTLNSKACVKIDGVAMGSPLGPVLGNISMVELEQNIISTLYNKSLWKRYADGTICFVKSNCINHVLEPLNSFLSHYKAYSCNRKRKQNVIFRQIINT